jgi:hypothetical protein
MFDVMLPSDYPDSPPEYFYHAYGMRLNPNLYVDGKVCLSLLGTWTGKETQQWNPDTSTLLQTLVSVQGLVLGVAEPYYNEAGYDKLRGTKQAIVSSVTYNEQAMLSSVQMMVNMINFAPTPFQKIIKHLFSQKQTELSKLISMDFSRVQFSARGSGEESKEAEQTEEGKVLETYGLPPKDSGVNQYSPSKGFLIQLKTVTSRLQNALQK